MNDTRKQRIVELQQQIRRWTRSSSATENPVCSTGCDALDALFPERGIQRGSLVEWIGDGVASGAGTLSLAAARRCCPADQGMILVDMLRQISPVALAALDFNLAHLVVVRPRSEQEVLWACEEALRCDAVGLVWARIARLTDTAFRRLQLAAEASAGIGFLLRPHNVLHQSSWAETRLLVQPRPSRTASPCWRVEVVYSQGRGTRSTADIQLDCLQGTIHESAQSSPDLMSVVSPLADSKAHCRPAGA